MSVKNEPERQLPAGEEVSAAGEGGGGTPFRREPMLRALIARVAQGDEQALAALYDETSSQVYGLAMTIVRSPADAEEITLDAFKRLWRSASRFDPTRGSVTGMLLVMTRNLAIDRKRTAAARKSEVDFLDAYMEMVPSLGPDPEQALSMERNRKLIQQAMETLPPEQRTAVEMSFLSGLTHQEIADQLGTALGTVKGRIRTGLSRLRLVLGEVAR
jgi:RNA polymerase sigma-70 factor (ECF subfamily)